MNDLQAVTGISDVYNSITNVPKVVSTVANLFDIFELDTQTKN